MAQKKSSGSGSGRWFGSLVVGAAVFAVFYLLHFGVPLAIAGASVGLIAGSLVFKPKEKFDEKLLMRGITPQTVAEAIRDGRLKIGQLRQTAAKISNPVVQFKVRQIADIADKIVDDIRRDPGDVKAARPFLNYYLDSTVKILESYADLASKKVVDKDVLLSMKRVEALLDSIKLAFNKQLAKLLENDMLDLDTEISVLEKTIQLDHGTDPAAKAASGQSPSGQSQPLA
jgi:5-bromo-4-chloroindolyl phosphate hydrolysis protein